MSWRRLPMLVTCQPPATNAARACWASPVRVVLFRTTSGNLPDAAGARLVDVPGDDGAARADDDAVGLVGVPVAVPAPALLSEGWRHAYTATTRTQTPKPARATPAKR